jgi:hypothetical protein
VVGRGTKVCVVDIDRQTPVLQDIGSQLGQQHGPLPPVVALDADLDPPTTQ